MVSKEKFYGSIEDLKEKIKSVAISGDWSENAGTHTFRSQKGGLLNWVPSKGSVWFQGTAEGKAELKQVVSDHNGPKTQNNKQIFIVHGHDDTARDQLELVLRRLGLEPFILLNSSGGGKTIIEALEGRIGKDFTSAFGIVLMTPDDFGYSKKCGKEKVEPRARQNVILEAGMLLSSLTRSRMAILIKGQLEIPSDLQGLIRFEYSEHIREIVPKLCGRLKEVNFQINSSQIAAASN